MGTTGATKTGAAGDGHGAVEHLLLHDHVWALRVAIFLWAVAGSLFVAMAIPDVRDAIESFDRRVYEAVYPVKWGPLTALAETLAFVGSGVFLWPLRAAVAGFLTAKRRWRSLTVWLLAIALSEPAIGILKAAYERARPAVALVEESTGAFPSGHAVAGSVAAISLVIVFVPAGPARRNLEMLAAVFALLMAGSRMYLGAHWFTDVAAGLAFGAACAVGAATIVHRAVNRDAGPAGEVQTVPGTAASEP